MHQNRSILHPRRAAARHTAARGMLFGKHASAGGVSITTQQAGDRGQIDSNATLNLPLGDRAALRVGGCGTRFDSLICNRLDASWRSEVNTTATGDSNAVAIFGTPFGSRAGGDYRQVPALDARRRVGVSPGLRF